MSLRLVLPFFAVLVACSGCNSDASKPGITEIHYGPTYIYGAAGAQVRTDGEISASQFSSTVPAHTSLDLAKDSQQSASAARSFAVVVDGQHTGWLDTGIDLSEECTVTFSASGKVVIDPYHYASGAGPAGEDFAPSQSRFVSYPQHFLFPNAPFGALIGYVNGENFVIGSDSSIICHKGGRLLLGINELWVKGCWDDNSGRFNVTIDVDQRTFGESHRPTTSTPQQKTEYRRDKTEQPNVFVHSASEPNRPPITIESNSQQIERLKADRFDARKVIHTDDGITVSREVTAHNMTVESATNRRLIRSSVEEAELENGARRVVPRLMFEPLEPAAIASKVAPEMSPLLRLGTVIEEAGVIIP